MCRIGSPLRAWQRIGYQGLRDFRGRGNLPAMVETLVGRPIAPAPISVFIYGLPWFALFSVYFLCYLLRGPCLFFRGRFPG